jgi:hypothetical protein
VGCVADEECGRANSVRYLLLQLLVVWSGSDLYVLYAARYQPLISCLPPSLQPAASNSGAVAVVIYFGQVASAYNTHIRHTLNVPCTIHHMNHTTDGDGGSSTEVRYAGRHGGGKGWGALDAAADDDLSARERLCVERDDDSAQAYLELVPVGRAAPPNADCVDCVAQDLAPLGADWR